jgi:flagellar basal body-associated protein FliL
MKHAILIIMLLASFSAAGQKPWDKLEIDSVEFYEEYGNPMQYAYQQQIKSQSSHKLLVVFIGSKTTYLLDFAYYLGTQNYDISIDQPEDNITIFAQKRNGLSDYPSVKVVATHDAEFITKKVVITGPADDLIKIFLGYWDRSDLSLNDLKKNKAVVKDFINDRVSFTWTGVDPVITVTKSPISVIDFASYGKK